MTLMPCEEITPLLSGVVDGSSILDRRSAEHVQSCLRCQAELAQYRRLLRSLRSLRDEPVAIPGDLAGLIFARIDRAVGATPWGRRAAYAGAVAATAAGAAGAIVLVAARSRRLRLAG